MFPPKPTIEPGDVAIIYEAPDVVSFHVVQWGKRFQNRFGLFCFDNAIGKPWGTKLRAVAKGQSGKEGWVYLLHPTPEHWTQALSHRTQILYAADIAYVLLRLGVRPGWTVVESGTGSGSLSVALARAVAPNGKILTYEFNEGRAQTARRDFEDLGLSSLITVHHQNVVEAGFGVVGQAHAVFLDLPAPWQAITHAKAALRACGALCSFSPCIEQVQRTAEVMRKEGFSDVRTFECLLRIHDTMTVKMEIPGCLEGLEWSGIQGKQGEEGEEEEEQEQEQEEASSSPPPKKRIRDEPLKRTPRRRVWQYVLSTRPRQQARGHTGYLTFALKESG